MIQGIIIKIISNFFYVKCGNSIVTCKARGKLKRLGVTLQVGDHVMIKCDYGTGYIIDLLPRRNCLYRPSVSNVDQMLIFIPSKEPEPDYLLIDKLTVFSEMHSINVVLCVSKCEMLNDDEKQFIKNNFSFTGYPVIFTSSYEKIGIEELRSYLSSKVTVLAGQSGAGKSTLLNNIMPGLNLETGELSEKIKRGKNTTRYNRLIEIGNNGMVIDTPGFSLLDFEIIDPVEFRDYYPEFKSYADKCRFKVCLHQNEPECAVKNALDDHQISDYRYKRYIVILNQIKQKWRDKYD